MADGSRRLDVVMADDCEDDRILTRFAFEQGRPGDTLRFVEDGEALLTALQAGPKPDVVLLDLHMPRMDGRAALAAIRADERLRDLCVVLLTSSTQDARDLGPIADAVDGILPKPVDPRRVAAVLSSLG